MVVFHGIFHDMFTLLVMSNIANRKMAIEIVDNVDIPIGHGDVP